MTHFRFRHLMLAFACGLTAACGRTEDDGIPAGIPLDGADLATIDVEWREEGNAGLSVLLDSSTAILLNEDAALVSDAMNAVIHRIEIVGDDDVRRFGGRGDGPGEFHSVGGLAAIADTLYVSDPVRGGVHLLDLTDLTFVTFRVWEAESRPEGIFLFVVNPPAGIWPLIGGNAIVRPNTMAVSAPPGRRAGLVRDDLEVPFPLLRQGESSWRVPTRLTERHEAVVVTEGGRTVGVMLPVAPTELFAAFPSGDGFVKLTQTRGAVRESARIEIAWFDPSGEEEATRNYFMEASALAEHEQAALADEAHVAPAGALPTARVQAILSNHDVLPDFRLRVTRIRGDQSRRLWLEIDEPGEGQRWIVLTDDGRVAGQVAAPEGTEFLGALGPAAVFGRPIGDGEFVPVFGRLRLDTLREG